MALNRITIIPIFLGLALFGCRPEPSTPVNNPPYHFVEFIRHSEGCAADSSTCAVFKAHYPKYDSADAVVRNRINESIMEAILDIVTDEKKTGNRSLQEVARDFFSDYREYANGPYAMPWELDCTGEVIYLSDRIFSLKISNYWFTGGAHPNTITNMLNYDLERGNIITLQDLVVDWDTFIGIAERSFRQAKGIDAGQSWQESGYFWGNEFKLSNNFAITEQGILLFYNTYEIAPYAAGITEFVISYADLKGIILEAYLPKAT